MASSLIGPVVGGLFANRAADKAANAAQAGTDAASRTQMEMFNRQVELTAPQRNAGNAAMNRMGHLLGLTRKGFSSPTQSPPYQNQLGRLAQMAPLNRQEMPGQWTSPEFGMDAEPTRTNGMQTNADIENFIASQYGEQQPQNNQPLEEYGTDDEYGSLMRDFGAKDFEKDPGYQFRLDEGNKALQRRAAAGNGVYSGAAMKDALRFSQGLATDEYGKAFDRFQVNRGNKLNPLFSLAGMGQQGVSALGQSGQNVANQIGGYQLGNANMQGAASITRGNALNSAFQNAWQGYQTRQQPYAFPWANKLSVDD